MKKTNYFAFVNKIWGTKHKEGDDVNPSEEQMKILGKAFPNNEDMPKKIVAHLNAKEDDDEALKASIIEHLASLEPTATATPAAEGEQPAEGEQSPQATTPTTTAEAVQALIEQNKLIMAANKILANQTEDDNPPIVGKNQTQMNTPKHTATALFGSAEPYMAFADRPWNKNVKAVLDKGLGSFVATDFTSSINVDKINEDFGAYARKNIDKVIDIFRDGLNLPKNWRIISNVSDELAYSAFVAGEITQGGSSTWKAKNEVKFIPMKAKVFDKKIDITFTGAELKSLEKTWIKSLAIFDNNGSNPYKESFVAFLLEKLLKRARHEDKLGLIKGVYFNNDLLDKPGKAINALNGLLKLAIENMGVHYNPFDLPKLNNANSFDTINSAVKQIPDELRTLPMQLNISPSDILNYKDGYRREHGTEANYNGIPNHVDGWENIMFEPVSGYEGTGFFNITPEDNIYILVDKLGEESSVTAEKEKRNMNLFVDYKLGPHVEVFGAQMEDGNIKGFGNQIFWSNNPDDLLADVAIPAKPNAATIDVKNHRVVVLGRENTAATNVTAIINATVGLIYVIKGNSETNHSTIKNGGDLVLSNGDFVATPTAELHLLAQAGGKFIEVDRVDLSASTDIVTIAPDATTVDAADGDEFVTSANTQATALTNIENAVAKETYIIKGGSSTNATTIANAGNFSLTATMTLNVNTFIELYYTGTKFVEVKRG